MSRECPTPHQCPHCRCLWDVTEYVGTINEDAPFYALVMLITDITRQQEQERDGRGRFGKVAV